MKSKSIVLLLFAMFVLPFIAAYWFYEQGGTGRTSNYGELLNPPISITKFLDKKEVSNVKGKWALLYIHQQACNFQCKDRIKMLNNLKIALGKNQNRVRMVWLMAGKEKLFIADPNGNVILHYAENFELKGLNKDLRHLLKASKIG